MTLEFGAALQRDPPPPSSPRTFGLVIAGALAALSLRSGFKHHALPPLALPLLSLFFASFALLYPPALAPLNWLWTKLGRLLHRVMSPLILGVLYFAVLTPFGLCFRLFRKDPLHLELHGKAHSYWIERPAGTQPGAQMGKQF